MSLYTELNLKGPDVSQEEIKKSFRDLSRLHHPDKGGNLEKYKQIVAAYEILGDPEKKKKYDQEILNPFGKSGRSVDLSDLSDLSDIIDLGTYVYHQLRRAYATSRHTFSFPARTANPDLYTDCEQIIEKEIKVTLEDLYNCSKKKLKITKREICTTCNGQGGKQQKCIECGGQYKICKSCDMKGFILDPVCKVCEGKQYSTLPKQITINLAPSINPEIPIDIKGVVDKDSILRIHLLETPHLKYSRVTSDWIATNAKKFGSVKFSEDFQHHLTMIVTVSIFDALGNFEYLHRHLDDQEYVFVYKDIIPPGTVLRARNMGLMRKKDKIRGDLFITFTHTWPTTLADEQTKLALQRVASSVAHISPASFVSEKQKIIFLELP